MLHSDWIVKLRKDVECAFGILKKRFRCLRLPILLKSLRDVENLFVTCCILHNMLIDVKDLTYKYLHGGWSRDDRPPPLYRDPTRRREYRVADSSTNFFRRVGNCLIVEEDGQDEWKTWRKRYRANYTYLRTHNLVGWEGPVECNDSMRTTL